MILGAFTVTVTVTTPIQYCHFFVVAVVPSAVPASEILLLHPLRPSIPTSCHTRDPFHTWTRQPDMAIPAYPPSFVTWGMIKTVPTKHKMKKSNTRQTISTSSHHWGQSCRCLDWWGQWSRQDRAQSGGHTWMTFPKRSAYTGRICTQCGGENESLKTCIKNLVKSDYIHGDLRGIQVVFGVLAAVMREVVFVDENDLTVTLSVHDAYNIESEMFKYHSQTKSC